jgi:glycine reductase
MHAENPGVDLGRADVVIAETGADARAMDAALERMAALARAAARGAVPGPAEGGYFARGLRLNVRVERPAAERALDLLLKKLRGEPFQTELTAPASERVAPAPPVRALAQATVALVTDGGLVVRGNPERLAPSLAERYTVVDVAGQERLDPAAQEVTHRGYDTALVNEDPNRLVPLDAARALEQEGRVGRLLSRVYTTAGCSAPLANARRIGQEIAEQLRAEGVEAVILTST